jgi:hypothetical protein
MSMLVCRSGTANPRPRRWSREDLSEYGTR